MIEHARPSPPPIAGRPFGVADGLILVAATAVGLAVTRTLEPGWPWVEVRDSYFARPDGVWSTGRMIEALAAFGAAALVPGLAVWTLAGLLMCLRRPRPSWREHAGTAGTMACLVASIAIALTLAGVVAIWATTPTDTYGTLRGRTVVMIAFGSLQAGAAVLWSWVAATLAGRLRAETTWPDRLGRLLGIGWITAAIFCGFSILMDCIRQY